jgi:hypothetical protein
MPIVLIAFALMFSLVWFTGGTFGQQCAKKFERDSSAWERCVERMDRGGTVNFERKIILIPAE